tara:strand:+ start:4477 stop:4821 length:345 start_codon:yes stop_codon:yes gene_type:complete
MEKGERPWGYWLTVAEEKNNFKIKMIYVNPDKRLSLQSHNHRSEHWVIVQGKANIQIGKDEHKLEKNQSIYIPKETLHRLENIGEEILVVIETQIGEYLEEDDIIRYEDDFNRC